MDAIDTMQFVWWQGVVEDRQDPLQLGRCRVRILGWHPQNRDAAETNELPWAFPMQPITSAAMSGIGHAPVGPVEGTWVFGFFRDGDNAQEPVMLGTFGGIPQEAPLDQGFFDPNLKYPLEGETHGLKEPDTTRLARTVGANILGQTSQEHPVVSQKLNTNDLGFLGVPLEANPVPLANSPETWNEIPTAAIDSKYPFNHAFQSESGHIQEFDDTPGAERVHTFHRAGTFEEWHPKGDTMRKVVGTDFEIVEGDDDLLVKGNLNITVNQEARVRVNGLIDVEVVEGDIRVIIRKGNVNVQVLQGNADLVVQGNLTTDIKGNRTDKVAGSYTVQVGGTYRVQAGQVTIRAGTIFLN